MRHRSSVVRQFIYFFILVAFSFSLQAQDNEILNSGFATSFLGWSQFLGGIGEWSPEDAGGSESSGSALLGNEGLSNGVVPLVIFQCIQVPNNVVIEFGGDLLVQPFQPPGTAAFIFIEQFDNSDCSGDPDSSHSTSSSFVGDWHRVNGTVNIDLNIQSVRLGLGVFKPNGETADAEAFFDNIFLYLPDLGEFVINPAMSASWYNPAESGHGIMIHLLNANTAWMCWFTFDSAGNRTWICAIGVIDGDTMTFEEAFTVDGGAFPPDFDPGQVEEVPWGSIVVVFTSCDSGTMTWTTGRIGFSSGQMPIARLTDLWGVPCAGG